MNDYNKYFNNDSIIEFRLQYPCKKSSFITELRKLGDKNLQYVTNVYYLDTLSLSFDENEIYSSYYLDGYTPVFSSYHPNCIFCKEHKQRVKENLIVGFKIYPLHAIPEKTYAQRKHEWKQYK